MTPNPNPSPELTEAIWKQACVGREGYCSSDLQQAAKWAIGEAFRLAALAARSAELPANYQWSEDNRSKFNFGRDTAVEAIAALSPQTLPAPGEVELREAIARIVCEIVVWITCADNATETSKQVQVDQAWRHWTDTADRILATVAAANDEGVALDWRAVAKLAGEHGVRYRTNTALEKFLAAIRLLSQGGGK